ncbi:MAG TPA: acyltransferase [Polyangiaceae bacterium]|nr:acyltransferase [Polyangiaceae bacterium]
MAKERTPHLGFLDGLRALASFYVLLFHEANPKLETAEPLSPGLGWLYAVLDQGRHSVVFFIVLSGYSLMLPVARSGIWELNGGFWRYIQRRGRRILPPYYAALFVSLLLIVGYNSLSARVAPGQSVDAALSPGSILSHLFLLHNLSFDWAFRINGPMWSVATEWQIYFILPLLLLPLARRVGMPLMVALAWLATSWPSFVLPDSVNLFWASPWFVGSFALGMYGAVTSFAPVDPAAPAPRRELPWTPIAAVLFVLVVVLLSVHPNWRYPLIDLPISLFAFAWINACAQLVKAGRSNLMLRVLQSRALVYSAGFSYSLYLVQHPILRLTEKAFAKLRLSHDANLLAHLFAVTPIVVAVAWVFSELVERPFTNGGVLIPALKRRFSARAAA